MPRFLVILISSIILSGCSFLVDLRLSQCSVDADCDSLGGDFRGRECSAAGLCEVPEGEQDGVTGSGDAASPDASTQECEVHLDCINNHFGTPHLCVEGACLSLVSSECPLVLNEEGLQRRDPVIVGAYSLLAEGLRNSPTTLNYELAVDEIQGSTPGLHGGVDGTRRPMVMVVCEGVEADQQSVEASLSHLVEKLSVPAVIATFNDSDLLRFAFERVAKQHDVFFLNPLAPNQELLREDTQGLLWSILGSWPTLAATYRPAVQRAEAFQRRLTKEEILRVALVSGTEGEAQDVSQALVQDPSTELIFTDNSARENGEEFRVFSLSSDGSNFDDVTLALLDFKPHIVVSAADTRFIRSVVPLIEDSWSEAVPEQVPPFYVLSRFAAPLAEEFVKPGTMDIQPRAVGINYATVEEDALYQAYLLRLKSANRSFPGLESTENFYDVVYFLFYAMAGADSTKPLRGSNIAAGMRRIITGSTQFEVGSNALPDVLAELRQDPDFTARFIGTMGPPDFNLENGTRQTPSSIWCLDPSEGTVVFDALMYDQDYNELTGDFPCFDHY